MLHTYTCLHIKHTTLPCSPRKIRAQRRSPELSGNWPDQWGETMAMSLGDQLLHKLQGLRKIWHYNLRSVIYCMNWSDLTVFMDAMERCSGWNLSLAKRLKQSFGVGNQLQNFQHQAWLSSFWLCLPCLPWSQDAKLTAHPTSWGSFYWGGHFKDHTFVLPVKVGGLQFTLPGIRYERDHHLVFCIYTPPTSRDEPLPQSDACGRNQFLDLLEDWFWRDVVLDGWML